MGAGEYVSVRSQRELLEASTPNPATRSALPELDVDANELSLVYRARGMSPEDADAHAAEVLGSLRPYTAPIPVAAAPISASAAAEQAEDEHEAVGNAWGAAISSFCFFASGALIPILPYLFGLGGLTAVIVSALVVGVALLCTGAVVGLLSGASPLKRALRQLAIGFGAAAATYLLGLLFGTTIG
jgi:VIT1/CCC1 family predicted Fe2+/Mn2+ transporter